MLSIDIHSPFPKPALGPASPVTSPTSSVLFAWSIQRIQSCASDLRAPCQYASGAKICISPLTTQHPPSSNGFFSSSSLPSLSLLLVVDVVILKSPSPHPSFLPLIPTASLFQRALVNVFFNAPKIRIRSQNINKPLR